VHVGLALTSGGNISIRKESELQSGQICKRKDL
jgi:hypothetical protein